MTVQGVADQILGRFRLGRCLGEGGHGRVYAATELETGALVALKTFRAVGQARVRTFKNEFRSLRDVAHPNLIQYFELCTEGATTYVTMELVEGAVDFEQWCSNSGPAMANATDAPSEIVVEPAPVGAGLPWRSLYAVHREQIAFRTTRVRGALAQLVPALEAVHAAGLIHCDIKATNILVQSSGRVVLLDFGLAAHIAPPTSRSATKIAGTRRYLAPERLSGAPAAPSTDWYALGVVLFRILTGAFPAGPPLDASLGGGSDALPVDALPEDDPPLRALVTQLLHPDPHRRASGADIRAWLSGGVYVEVIPFPSVFVGREAELGELGRLVAFDVNAPAVAGLRGASGIGKSALLAQFVDAHRRLPRCWVVSSRCHPMESIPFRAFDEVIDSLADQFERLSTAELPVFDDASRAALRRLFPALGVVFSGPDDATSTDAEMRRRAFTAVGTCLSAVCRSARVVVVMDDLQWADDDSLDLLESLVLRGHLPVVWVLAWRAEDESSAPLVRCRDLVANNSGERTTITLGPLDTTSSLAVCAANTLLSPPLSDQRVSELLVAANGRPFFLVELARATAFIGDGPLDVDTVALARIGRLPSYARQLVTYIAVSGQPVPRFILAAAAPGDLVSTLEMLRRAGIVRYEAGAGRARVAVYHDRLAEAVAASLDPHTLVTLHDTLANAWLAASVPASPALAHHLSLAGRLPEAGRWAVRAAQEAESALAFDQAASFWTRARDLGGGGLEPWQIARYRAEALVNARLGTDAAAAFVDAVESAVVAKRPTLEVVDLERRAASELLKAGHVEAGLPALARVLRAVGVSMPRGLIQIVGSLLYNSLRLFWMGGGRTLRAERSQAELDRTRLEALWTAATGLTYVDALRALPLVVRHVVEAIEAGDRACSVRGLAYAAAHLAMVGGPRRRHTAHRFLDNARGHTTGSELDRAYLQLGDGVVAYFGGEWGRAVDSSELAARAFEEHCRGSHWEQMNAWAYAISARGQRGDLRGLAERLPALVEDADKRADIAAATYLRLGVPSYLLLAADRPDDALRVAHDRIEWWRAHSFMTMEYLFTLTTVSAQLYCHRPEEALAAYRSRVGVLRRAGYARLELVGAELHFLEARALVACAASAHSGGDSLRAAARRCAAAIRRATLPPTTPYADLIDAALAHQLGQEGQATELLRAARTRFHAAGMALHVAAIDLVGGGPDRSTAEARFAAQGVKAPERLAHMIVSGFR